MSDEITAATLERVADRYGIDLGDDGDAHLETVRTLALTMGVLEAEAPETPTADAIRPGEDPYGAFRRRFDLPSADGGPLGGLDVAVKENAAVAGVETTCGSAALSYVPSTSATVVERLRGAGASVVGTTNMDSFAYFTTGETCAHGRIENPAAAGRVPGGSSSGSGAAVAGGLIDAALGTDTAGSVRIPASYCGVVGIKPTHRLVPRSGVVDLSPSLDHVGPLAPDVETAATVLEAIAGPDVADPTTYGQPPGPSALDGFEDGVADLSVGLVEESAATASEDVESALESGADALADAGATVERVSLPGYDLAGPAAATIIGAEFARLIADDGVPYGPETGTTEPLREALAATDPSEMEAHVREQVLYNGTLNEALGGRQYLEALGFRRSFAGTVRERLADVDALLTPTTPTAALEFDSIEGFDQLLRTLTDTAPFNLTGSPAVSVPHGETVDGRPVGLQVVADWYAEPTALRVARALEVAA